MNAKEAANKTKAVKERKRKLEAAKEEAENRIKRANAVKRLPDELEKVFACIQKAANEGSNYTRWTVHYNGMLAQMVFDRLVKESYKVTMQSDGGYTYNGEYLGPTTEWTISISW